MFHVRLHARLCLHTLCAYNILWDARICELIIWLILWNLIIRSDNHCSGSLNGFLAFSSFLSVFLLLLLVQFKSQTRRQTELRNYNFILISFWNFLRIFYIKTLKFIHFNTKMWRKYLTIIFYYPSVGWLRVLNDFPWNSWSLWIPRVVCPSVD